MPVYTTQTWSISGEHAFENDGYTLLNPDITVSSVTFAANNVVHLALTVKEDGGVYEHRSHANYTNASGEVSIDAVVNAAMAAVFPTATVTPPLA
jgi:hypothetical protein